MDPPNDLVQDIVRVHFSDGPIVAVAIHDGHAVRPEIAERLLISEANRLREEDSFTSRWTRIASTQVVGLRSRFEVDLNRLRKDAVYRTPEDAWGLHVWKQPLEPDIVDRSLAIYDAFYSFMFELLSEIKRRHGAFFVYDLHSYNHHREGPASAFAEILENPQINICTGGMDLDRCEGVVSCFERAMKEFDFPGGPLDVRRNVRFRATRFSRWVHENFPGSGVSLGIEVKKFYMNEWTGEVDDEIVTAIGRALESTVAPIKHALKQARSVPSQQRPPEQDVL